MGCFALIEWARPAKSLLEVHLGSKDANRVKTFFKSFLPFELSKFNFVS